MKHKAPTFGRSPASSEGTQRGPLKTGNATGTAQPVKPKTCGCLAYRWPHRPGGGLCRWPAVPLERCPTPAGTNRPLGARVRPSTRWWFRRWGLNPIRDRAAFVQLRPLLDSGRAQTIAEARRLYRWLEKHERVSLPPALAVNVWVRGGLSKKIKSGGK